MIHPCKCTSYNGTQCYNCLNGAHKLCEGKCRKKNAKHLGLRFGIQNRGDNKEVKAYHGTTAKPFTQFVFKPRMAYVSDPIGAYMLGACFSESYEIAKTYPPTTLKGEIRRVVTVEFSVENPKEFKNMKALVLDMVRFFGFQDIAAAKMAAPFNETVFSYMKEKAEKYRKHLIAEGFDSVTYHEGPAHHTNKRGHQARVWVVLDPRKIKILDNGKEERSARRSDT